jgi:thiamine biosynthesis lipoprotein
VRVTPGLFALLQHAKSLHAETHGAFDITVAPLVRCWGFMGGTGKIPRPEELEAARACVGMQFVELERADFSVRFAREGMMLDLGAIGKGYAIERAAGLLREAGVTSALLHGGTSTVYALGKQPDGQAWHVAVENPRAAAGLHAAPAPPETAPSAPSVTVPLTDEAMSVSAVWGKSFAAEGKVFGHVLDPRSGLPVSGAVLAAVVLPSATETDALSTALLTLGGEGQEHIAGLRPGMRTLVVAERNGGFEARGIGIQLKRAQF